MREVELSEMLRPIIPGAGGKMLTLKLMLPAKPLLLARSITPVVLWPIRRICWVMEAEIEKFGAGITLTMTDLNPVTP
jgi:hypothetical protein